MKSIVAKVLYFLGSCILFGGSLCFLVEDDIIYITGMAVVALGSLFYVAAWAFELHSVVFCRKAKEGQAQGELGGVTVGLAQHEAAAPADIVIKLESAEVWCMLLGSVMFSVGAVTMSIPFFFMTLGTLVGSFLFIVGSLIEQERLSFLGMVPVPLFGQFPKSLVQTMGAMFLFSGNIIMTHGKYQEIGLEMLIPAFFLFFLASKAELLAHFEAKKRRHLLTSPYISKTAV